MNFLETYNSIMGNLILESRNQLVAIFPGGFKPPHKGHYELVKAYASDPMISQVKILLGPKTRKDSRNKVTITESMSREIWENYYIPTLPGNVVVDDAPDPVPVRASYVYVQEIAPEGEFITLMSSIKDVDDAKRSKEFAEKHAPGAKYYREGVQVVYYPKDTVARYENRVGETETMNGRSISASMMREDIANRDLANFVTNLPNEVRDYADNILNILNPN